MTITKPTRKKLLLTICALFLTIAMTLGIVYAGVPSLPTTTSTTDQTDFPLQLTPVVNESTITFRPPTFTGNTSTDLGTIANPVDILPSTGVFDQLDQLDVDTSALEVGLRVTLKEGFATSYPCNVLIYHGDDEDFRGTIDSDTPVFISRLIYDEPYQICVTVEDDNKITDYIGRFFYGVDVGNVVFISLEFRKDETFKNQINANSARYYEVESNNTLATANTVQWGRTIDGHISSASDVDYFKLVNPDDKYRKIDFISRNLSSEITISFDVYYSGTNNLVTTWSVGPNSSYHRTAYIPSYLAGNYYIKARSSASPANPAEYLINANLASTYVWYSQLDGYIGGIHYWNTEKLDQLIISKVNYGAGSKNNLVFTDHTRSMNSDPDDAMRKSCGIVSLAMLIRNRGLYMSGHTDYRYGTSGLTYADPFMVFLAANRLTGTEINASTNRLPRTVSTDFRPTNVNMSLYTKSITWDGTTTVGGWSTAQKEQMLKDRIQNRIGGVVIGFNGHFIIATGYNASATNVNDRFIVCETLSVNPSAADNVPYSKTWSYGYYGNITNYQSLYYIQE